MLRSSPSRSLPRRIRDLCAALEELLDRLRPQEIAVEGLFTARNVKSALTLAQLRGAYLLTLARRGIDVAEYSPRSVKQSVTGQGGASKEQVRAMVLRMLGGSGARLDPAVPLDASDALAVAICHAHTVVGRLRRRQIPG